MTRDEQYTACLREIRVRLDKGGDAVADLGNVAAVLKKRLGFFWIGFYFVRGGRLVLGPFQGAPACVYLPLGQGVCGSCASKKETIIVPDVHRFEGHIVCDPDSKSEIVVPLLDNRGNVRAVLDADSDRLDAFDGTDRDRLEEIGRLLQHCWT